MAVFVNPLGNLSLESSFPPSEVIFQAIQIAKQKENYEPLRAIVEKCIFQKNLFNIFTTDFPSRAVFKSISCLAKSGKYFNFRSQLQKCLQLVFKHCDSLAATPEEKKFLQSKKDLCFQCRDGNYSINKLLFQLAFPEYYQAFTHFTKSASQIGLQGQLSVVDSKSSEEIVENLKLPFSVSSIQFLEYWLLGADYEVHLGNLTAENGLDLYYLGQEYLSKDLQERAFNFIRSRIGYVLGEGNQMCRSPDWVMALLVGIALSEAKTSPFFIRLKKEICDLKGEEEFSSQKEVSEQLMRTHLGMWSIFAKDEWRIILDHQHLCGQSFPLVRSYLDVCEHRHDKSLEGALCRTLLATHKEDPQIELCAGYSTDSRRDILTNQAMYVVASFLDGIGLNPFSQAFISKISEEDHNQILQMRQLLRKEDVAAVKLRSDRCVTPSEFIALENEDSLAGLYLRESFLTKTMKVVLKSSRDLEDFMHLLNYKKIFIEGVSTISVESSLAIPKEFPRHPLIPGSVEIVQGTGMYTQIS